jgi:hypothetical protein
MPGAPKTQPPEKRPLATPKEVADYLGGGEREVTEATLKSWRYKRTGPRWIPVGKHVRYDWDDVEAWLDARRKGRDVSAQGAA